MLRSLYITLALFLTLFVNTAKIFAQPGWAWAKGVHSTASEWANDVAVDPLTGEVVVVGVFNSDLSSTFGSLFAGANGGGFVAKYNSAGNVIWAFPIGNNNDDACNGVVVSPNGNIYVTGYLQNTADFAGTSGISSVYSSVGGKDMFLAKYNSLGQLQWVVTEGGASDDEGFAVCTNTLDIFVTGYFTGSGSFSGIPTISNQPNQNLFVVSYNANGAINWLTDGGSGQNTFGRDITADNNSVYITGDFENGNLGIYDYMGANVANIANSSASKADAYVMALSVTGPFMWAKGIHSSSDDYGRGIVQNSAGIFVTGALSASANFPGYVSNPVNPGAQGLDMYVAQLSKSSGNTNWVKSEPGNSNEQGMSIAIDTLNLVTVAGYFDSNISFNGGSNTLNTFGNEDVFVAAYNNTGTYQWVTQAGAGGTDIPYGIYGGPLAEIYVAGEYENNAKFGTIFLTPDSPKNIFVAKLGCAPISNNNITAAQTICSGQTPVPLAGSTPAGGSSPYTYLWQQSPNALTWASASGTNNTQNYSPPALASSTYYRRVVSSLSGCIGTDTSTKILITVNQQPTTANAGIDSSICANTINLYANTPTVGSGIWQLIAGSGTITSTSSPTTAVSGLAPGTNVFIWKITNGGCPPSIDTVKIKVYTPPTPANAGPNQNICSSTVTLNANPPTVGTGSWQVIAGTATVTSVNAPNSSATGLSAGANTFVWTITNGACGFSKDTVVITRSLPPTPANAGINQSICSNTVALTANSPSVGTGAWIVLSGGATVTNPTLNITSASGLSGGVNAFEWIITNGSCPPSRDTVFVNASQPPTPSNAGPDQTICSTTYTLNANIPSVGTGSWTVVSGGATVVSATSHNSSANNLGAGTNIFVWTISSGTCPSSKDTVKIKVDVPPTPANAGSNQTICNDSTLLSANALSVGTGTWTLVSGGGNISSAATNTTIAYNLNPGTHVFMWSTGNGVCPISSSTISVTVNAPPSQAIAGSDQTICGTSSTLNAVASSSGSGLWSVISGGGIISNPIANTTGVNGLSVGVNLFQWTVSNGVCAPSRDTMKIIVDANPSVADAGVSQAICASSTTVNAVAPAVGNGTWSVLSGTGTVATPSLTSTSVSGLSPGVNVLQWQVSNGVCPPSIDTIAVFVYLNPSISNAGPDQTICTRNGTLIANVASVGSGIWNVVSGGGTVANPASGNTSVTALSVGTNIFVWTISNGVCASSSDTVVIYVSAPPAPANAGSDQNVCIGSSVNLNAIQLGSGVSGSWAVIGGGAAVTNPTQYNSAVTSVSTGTNTFVWSVTNGICPSSSDTVLIIGYSNPTPANAGSDITVPTPSVMLNANTPTNGTGSWSVESGTGNFSSPNNPTSNVTGLSIGDNVFGWTISNGVCPDSYDEVIVHINDLVIPNGFSPNGDLVNDNFEVPGIDQYSDVKLEVFNRWGNLVYENLSYKNDWGGKNLSGEDLTDDTYYYTLSVGKAKPYKGFVVLKRK